MLWLFDLDNTLHDASAEILPRISKNMNGWLAKHYATESGTVMSEEEADALRQDFWRRHGATLLGISKVFNYRAKSFLKAAHHIQGLNAMVHAEKGLKSFFKLLPGKKILLTNSSGEYAKRILKILGLTAFFDRILSIETMCLAGKITPKPSKRLFRHLPVLLKAIPSQCALIEDDIKNLKSAKTAGMKTILVTRYLNRNHQSSDAYAYPRQKKVAGLPFCIDVKIHSLHQLKWHLLFKKASVK